MGVEWTHLSDYGQPRPLTLNEIFKGSDVAGEARAKDGKWTGGGSATDETPRIDVSALVGRNGPEHIFHYFDKPKFDADQRSRIVNVRDLVSTKDKRADPRVISGEKADPRATAAKFMIQSARGEVPPRKPITVTPHEDGSGRYRVLDGNATTQVAQMAGWEHLPTTVLSAAEAHAFEESERARKATKKLGKMTLAELLGSGDILKAMHDVAGEPRAEDGEWTAGGGTTAEKAPPEDSVTDTQTRNDAIALHKRVISGPLDRAMAKLQHAFPNVRVEGRAKSIESICEKLKKDRANEPDKEHTASGLSDVLATRMSVPDIDTMKGIIKSLHDMRDRGEFNITREKNYIDTPKDDHYRSYHFNFNHEGINSELQLRTPNQTKWADWAHEQIYKPHSNRQTLIRQNMSEIEKYAAQMSDHYYDVDRKIPNPTPPAPCTDVIKITVGCLE